MSTLSKSNVAISLTLFSLAIAGLLMWYGGELPASSFPAVNLTAEQRNLLALVSYVNAKGQEWSIPQGEYAFNVSSKSGVYPSFLSGDIDPLDVKVGDTQRMKIIVVDVAPLKQAYAEIEHDAGKDRVELKLTATKTAAREAAYTYEGQWIVHDTHTKTYRTTFTAESQAGGRSQFTMAWSDPVCEFNPTTKELLSPGCSPQNGDVEGFDGGSWTIPDGVTITMQPGAKLFFNPGTSLSLPGSQPKVVNLESGASIERGYAFNLDADGDGYTTNAQRYFFTSPSQPGYVRAKDLQGAVNQIASTLDCYDSGTNASNVHPGQTQYFGIRDGRGSFDYDCNGSIAGVYTAAPNGNLSISSGYDPVYSYGTVASKEIGSCTADSFNTFVATDCGAVSSASNACAIGAAPFPQLSFLERTWNSLVPDALAIGPVRYEGFFSNSNCTNCISKDLKGYCR